MSDRDKHHQAIGHVSAQFGRLEINMAHLVITLMGVNDLEIGRIVVRELAFRRTYEVAYRLLKRRDVLSALTPDFKAMMVKFKRIEEKRNDVIHSTLAGEGPSLGRLKLERNQIPGLEYTTQSPKEIEAVAIEIDVVNKELRAFHTRLADMIQAGTVVGR